jgi:hypothetical protein
MKSVRAAIALACVALVAACSDGSAKAGATTALTEPQVRALVEKVEAATSTENDRAITEPLLADDLRVTWRTPGEPTEELDKDEFLEELDETLSEVGDMDYAYQIGAVSVAADGKSATAAVAVTESFDYQGSHVVATSDQVYRIELREGEPKIVALEADTTGVSVDGAKQF